ncbi:hypothetical protein ACFYXF_04895 [Streptomyces sp. NPDC002680]|uniref:hypothetical protein n=1 Tax=Streptomyces sp. NPDC002680 TaxID=3364659 RepID=UPI003680B60D
MTMAPPRIPTGAHNWGPTRAIGTGDDQLTCPVQDFNAGTADEPFDPTVKDGSLAQRVMGLGRWGRTSPVSYRSLQPRMPGDS